MSLNLKKYLNATIIMIIGALTAKILGFVRDVVLAKIYGTSNVMDAYVISNTIPNIVLACFGVAIANTIVSLFSNEKKQSNEENAKKVLDTANLIMICMSMIFIIITLLGARFFVKIIANGFDNDTLNLAITLTKITSASILFISLNYVLNGYLQYKNKFFLTSFSGSYSSMIVILLALLKVENIYSYAWAWVIGALLQFITVYIVSKKNKYKFKLGFKDVKKYIKPIIYLSVPLMISYSIQQINVIVDRSIASSLFVGAVSALNYANIIIVAVTAVIITPIVTVQYSKMAKLESDKDLRMDANNTIDIMSLVMIPVTFAIILFSKQIIYLLFFGGNFDFTSLDNTYKALTLYSIGIIFTAYRDTLIRVCLVKKDSKLPMISNILAVILNIILNIVLSKYLSHIGLALATSISLGISMCVLLFFVKTKYGKIFNKGNMLKALKVIVVNVFCSIIIVILNNKFANVIYVSKQANLLYSIVSGTIFVVLYIILLKLWKIDFIQEIKSILKNKGE